MTNKDYISLIESSLRGYLEKNNSKDDVTLAMGYSLLSGGKRVRPTLTLEFCKACGGDFNMALPFACAVEMVHTYSLIHDDLPCMDNDDLRRGRPTNHIVNGEALALLAGDALLNLAFEVMLSDETVKLVGGEKAIASAKILANCSGRLGMIGGQAIDLKSEGEKINLETLEELHLKKTGALISAAAQIGCIVAGADKEKLIAAKNYAKCLGLAFQVMDDVLEATSSDEKLGKSTSSDILNKKATYVSVLGLEKSKKRIDELTKEAIDSLYVFGQQADALKKFAFNLAKRDT
ncbi:MAG: Farnesyl diphosphate synthase [Eubacteriales bacterium SKADARSKE-1]|nr:Farnesyl diphosphate synthase [Eubacteriales bacterium SKADARSKE-1]